MPKNSVFFTTLLLTLLASTASAMQGPADKSGIEGRVQLSPGCPGPQRIDQPACVSAMPGAVVALQTQRGKTLRKTTTDTDGLFRFAAQVGTYVVHVEIEGMYPRCPDVEVRRVKGQAATVVVACDSGLR